MDISQEEIICWNPERKEKTLVSQEEFEKAAEVSEDTEAALAVSEIFQAGYMEICGIIYCLANRGFPAKYLLIDFSFSSCYNKHIKRASAHKVEALS